MDGTALAFRTSDASSRSCVDTTPRRAPETRRRFVTARVSIPSTATTPCRRSQSPKSSVDRKLLRIRLASRTTNPSTHARSDSMSSGLTP